MPDSPLVIILKLAFLLCALGVLLNTYRLVQAGSAEWKVVLNGVMGLAMLVAYTLLIR